MKKITSLLLASLLLVGCGNNSNITYYNFSPEEEFIADYAVKETKKLGEVVDVHKGYAHEEYIYEDGMALRTIVFQVKTIYYDKNGQKRDNYVDVAVTDWTASKDTCSTINKLDGYSCKNNIVKRK